jgi:hypothetical protein
MAALRAELKVRGETRLDVRRWKFSYGHPAMIQQNQRPPSDWLTETKRSLNRNLP